MEIWRIFIFLISSFPKVFSNRDDSCLGIEIYLLNHQYFPHKAYSDGRCNDGPWVGKAGLENGQVPWSPYNFSPTFESSALASFSGNLAAPLWNHCLYKTAAQC